MNSMYPDSHPIEPRDFSEKWPRVALSKPGPSQTREQSQVMKQNMTKSLGSMGWAPLYNKIISADQATATCGILNWPTAHQHKLQTHQHQLRHRDQGCRPSPGITTVPDLLPCSWTLWPLQFAWSLPPLSCAWTESPPSEASDPTWNGKGLVWQRYVPGRQAIIGLELTIT